MLTIPLSNHAKTVATEKIGGGSCTGRRGQWSQRREENEEGRTRTGRSLFPPFLHVVLDELFSVLFEDLVDLIDELVDIFREFLPGLNDLRIRLDLVFRLRLAFPLLLAL